MRPIPGGNAPQQPVSERFVENPLRNTIRERGLTVRKFSAPRSIVRPDGSPRDLERLYEDTLPDKQGNVKEFSKVKDADKGKDELSYDQAYDLGHKFNDMVDKQARELRDKGIYDPPDQVLYWLMGQYLTPAQELDPAIRTRELEKLLDTSRDHLGSAEVRAERQRRRIDYIHAQRSERDGITYGQERYGFGPAGYLHTRGLDLENQAIYSSRGVEVTPRATKHMAHKRGPASEKVRLQHEYQPRMTVVAQRAVGRLAISTKNKVNEFPVVRGTRSLKDKAKARVRSTFRNENKKDWIGSRRKP
ncbi:MAG TPA: hypothetical protein VNG32_04845 [Candidatus Dormibacteraeota bacterium]|nr:hypothetical protein [Candidatus Dormibacteraeota bacterium]